MTTVLNVKIDEKLKKEAQKVAKELGVPVSLVVSTQLKEFVRTRTLTISDAPRLKPEVEKELLELSEKARRGEDLSPAFSDVDEAIAWLHKEVDKEQR